MSLVVAITTKLGHWASDTPLPSGDEIRTTVTNLMSQSVFLILRGEYLRVFAKVEDLRFRVVKVKTIDRSCSIGNYIVTVLTPLETLR